MKQTAVEWFKDVIESFGNKHELQMSWDTFDELLEQAKAMEKEQIMNARINGDMNPRCISHLAKQYAELYYLETYGGKDAGLG
jgi:DUF438 domain-containing protein